MSETARNRFFGLLPTIVTGLALLGTILVSSGSAQQKIDTNADNIKKLEMRVDENNRLYNEKQDEIIRSLGRIEGYIENQKK